MSYKEDHEEFVSNLSGSDIWSILICIAHVPVLSLLLKHVQGHSQPSLLRDFLVYSFPLLLVVSVASNYAYWSLISLFMCAILIYRTRIHDALKILRADFNSSVAKNTYYLTLFKGANVFVTCVAILAVDFNVFPREYGKTETFGVSLMDAGVGSFIISSAITSKYARGVVSKPSKDTSAFTIPYQKLFVLLLGVGRMIILKAINYQEHVSEYGVHWNFFVTLFCVWTAADVVHWLSDDRVQVAMLSCCHLIVYQTALLHTPLTEYMMTSTRDTLISANKEGLFSLNGYIPLYLLTECVSFYLFFNEGKKNCTIEGCQHHTHEASSSSNSRSSGSIVEDVLCDASPGSSSLASSPFYRMSCASGLFWLVWTTSAVFVQPTSRRLVNIPYCALSLALSLSTVTAMFFVEAVTATAASSKHIPLKTPEYMSKHSLVVFLLANLMTGLINKTFETIHMNTVSSMAILSVYTLYLTMIGWGSERFFGSKN